MNFVSVVGYGWSGSSAYIELLKELNGISALPGEFRIARDPYGLVYLEDSLVHNWDFIGHDIAIRNFLEYCEMLSIDTGIFKKAGKNFTQKLDVNFLELKYLMMLVNTQKLNMVEQRIFFQRIFIHLLIKN